MSKSFSLSEIAEYVGGMVRGDAQRRVSGVAGVAEAKPDEITWLSDPKYKPQLRTSQAGAVVVAEGFGETPMPAILCGNPSLAIITILEKFSPPIPAPAPGIHPSACVANSAKLGSNVAIGPYVVVGERVEVGEGTVLDAHVFVGGDTRIGRDCRLWPNVVIRERCILGDRVVIHPNSTIGADGFGYEYVDGKHVKIPQIGAVEIEADVEIGAGCTIDRAKFGVTRIGRGTKIDNQVQVAHNVQIGADCIIVAQCGIAGSTKLGQGVVLGGKVGVGDHVTLHDGVQAAACACISKDLPPGARVFGIPAIDSDQWVRERAKVRRLPKMVDQLKDLIRRVNRLESSADD